MAHPAWSRQAAPPDAPALGFRAFTPRLRPLVARWEARAGSRGWLIAACAAVFLAGVAARLTLLLALGYQPAIEVAEIEQLAMNLAASGTLGDPYEVPTGPSAHHAPVYPALLAGIFLLWGHGSSAAWAMVLMNATFASLQYALLPALARVARLAILPAAAAALVGAAVPFRVLTESRWETTLSALAAVLAVIASLWWGREALTCGADAPPHVRRTCEADAPPHVRGWRSCLRSVGVGAVWGFALLTAPSLLPVFLLVVLWWALSPLPEGRRPRLAQLAALLVAAAAVLAPWTIRNYRALGGLLFVRSNFGLEFSVSNHDCAYVMAKDNNLINLPDNYFHRNHPFSSREHALRVQRIGEIAYNRERLAHALAWCRARPYRFAELTVGRFVTFWTMPTRTQPWKDALLQPITALGFVGLVVVWRRNRPAGAVFAAVLVGYPLAYYLVQVDSRYRYPMDWAVLLLAAYAAAALAARADAWLARTRSAIDDAPARAGG